MRVREPDYVAAAPAVRRARVPYAREIARRLPPPRSPRLPQLGAPEPTAGTTRPTTQLRHRGHDPGARAHDRTRAEGTVHRARHRDGRRARQPAESRSAAVDPRRDRDRGRPGRGVLSAAPPSRHCSRHRATCCSATQRAPTGRPGATRTKRTRPSRSSARHARRRAKARRAIEHRGARARRTAHRPVKNLPALDDPSMAPLRASARGSRGAEGRAEREVRSARAAPRGSDAAAGSISDTMLASYVLDPGRRSHGLDLLALEFLDHTMTSYDDLCGKGKQRAPVRRGADRVRARLLVRGCRHDVAARAALSSRSSKRSRSTSCYRDIEVPLVGVLADVEWAGIEIDIPWFASLKERFARERQRVEQEIYVSAGGEFNINSNPQLREVLFERLELPILKKTATGPSTDASVLQELAEAGHELPVLLMEYRELSKLESTYLDALPQLVNPHTGRLHTSFNQTVAATGRLSSSDPNLQNIPIRRELGRDIRRGFVPRKGWLFLAADYSQIELRLLAHLSGDPAFVEAFNSGGDIHRQTAALIFDVPLEQVTSEMRGRAKTINFATIYGQGAHALSRQLKISHAEAKEFIERYFERFQRVRAVSRLDGGVCARARIRRDDLQAPPLHPGAARSELQHPRIRRAYGGELADSGLSGRPDQDRDDPDRRAAPVRAAAAPDAASGARRARVRGARARDGRRAGACARRDGRRREPVGAAGRGRRASGRNWLETKWADVDDRSPTRATSSIAVCGDSGKSSRLTSRLHRRQ